MIRIFIFLMTLTMMFACTSAEAGIQVKMSCQQSVADGHILVANTHMLPAGSKFKVIGFQPTEQANGWKTGPCLLDVTPKASR